MDGWMDGWGGEVEFRLTGGIWRAASVSASPDEDHRRDSIAFVVAGFPLSSLLISVSV